MVLREISALIKDGVNGFSIRSECKVMYFVFYDIDFLLAISYKKMVQADGTRKFRFDSIWAKFLERRRTSIPITVIKLNWRFLYLLFSYYYKLSNVCSFSTWGMILNCIFENSYFFIIFHGFFNHLNKWVNSSLEIYGKNKIWTDLKNIFFQLFFLG